jgi:multisubunit Na+/H+ antiporter MnhF subunit
VNPWLLAGSVLLLGLVPCIVVAARASAANGIVALQLAGVVAALAILLLAVGFDRSIYADAAILIALLSFAGGMAFVRFLQRWG